MFFSIGIYPEKKPGETYNTNAKHKYFIYLGQLDDNELNNIKNRIEYIMYNKFCPKKSYNAIYFNCNHFTFAIVQMINKITQRNFSQNYPKKINKIPIILSKLFFCCKNKNIDFCEISN
jgi:hypothetical protein